MPVTTWWGLIITAFLIGIGGWLFRRWIILGSAKRLEDFRRWTICTAVASVALVLLFPLPFESIFPLCHGLRDVSVAANAIGPLALTVSVTLASIFYSVGEWYEAAQRFRLLGI